MLHMVSMCHATSSQAGRTYSSLEKMTAQTTLSVVMCARCSIIGIVYFNGRFSAVQVRCCFIVEPLVSCPTRTSYSLLFVTFCDAQRERKFPYHSEHVLLQSPIEVISTFRQIHGHKNCCESPSFTGLTDLNSRLQYMSLPSTTTPCSTPCTIH